MIKYAIPAVAAALALAACDQSETTVEGDEVATAPAPTATETAVVAAPVEGDEGSSITIDGGDVDATIGEDGVKADIKID